MDKLRVAVIGTGMIANAAHIPAYLRLPESYELVAVADIREQAAQETAKRYHLSRYYTDPQVMLDTEKPDIVSVSTTNLAHHEWAIKSFQAGAHVICEKPIALNRKDAEEMYLAAEKAGKQLVVCQTMRYGAEFVRDLINRDAFGEIYHVQIESTRRRGVPTWGLFHRKEFNGGGCFCDMGVHMLDRVIWLLGNPKIMKVSGVAYKKLADQYEDVLTFASESGAPGGLFTPRPYDYKEFDVEESSMGLVRLENGASINFRVTWAINLPKCNNMFLAGTKGGLMMNPLTVYSNINGYQSEYCPQTKSSNPQKDETAGIPFYGHTKLFAHVAKLIKGQEEPFVKKEEVLNVISGVEAFYRSIEDNSEVIVNE